MSTLVCETITNGTDSISIDDNIKGTARAWVSAASNGNINSSYNIASVAELPNNLIKITFATPFADTNYVAVSGPVKLFLGNDPFVLQEYAQPGDGRTTSYCIFYINQNGVNRPSDYSIVFYSL